ncbi:hypothetical protein CASFOL_013948 [Castilleja foliolosa]|uniref:Pentatricopeptide repeat-containing protein n=1 Tax=Castilleja foliolosa TaxID=1961234 RepID=A0ABD3DLH1_9LAMI
MTNQLSSLINSLCHSRKLREAINLALSHTLEPHQYTIYSKIIQLCTELNSTKFGHFIHSRIITNGFPTNTSLSTRLIMFYSKINEMGNARKVFDQMSNRTVVTWTALISGYSHNLDYEESLRVFSTMHCEGMKANQFTYASALSSSKRLLCLELGKQIQGCVQKRRFVGNLFVQSALVDLHSKCGDMSDACRVFESMETRDLVSWNAMIGGYVAQGMSDDAILVFCWMLVEGIVPDVFTFGSVLRATAGKNRLAAAIIVHGYIIQFGLGSHKFLNGSLIDAYVKCGDLDSATQVYNHMQNKDLVSCTSLIKGYALEGTNCTSALRLFNEVQKYTAIDAILLCSMINICAKTASLSLGRQLHAIALKNQNRHDLAICNALIDMYSKSGALEDAKRIFAEMEGKNVISWTSLIAGYGKHGYGHEAYELYIRMRDEGLKPNDVTFLSLLFACSHNGLTIQGWECFSDMVIEYNILPRPEHYTCLVDLLGRAGRLEEAYDLMCRVSADSDVSLLGALLGACSTYGYVNLGEIVARRLFKLEPDNLANYVVLSGIYAAAGLWDLARETRMLMEKRAGSKARGFSLCLSASENEALLT